jgi:hypothetical protein
MRLSVLVVPALMAIAAPANAATVLFSQNFDALPEGIPAASVPGFTITGTVDVVTNGNFGITCVGNTGACLDIDGTPGPGALTTVAINYLAGRQVTLSFDLSGNQRNADRDDHEFTVDFGQPTDINGFACLSGFVPLNCTPGDYVGLTGLGTNVETIPGGRPWVTYSLVFTPTAAGSLTMRFASPSADNIGPLIDNVLATQAAVPEPASWAMLIAGFGLVGAAQRRRKPLAA